VEKLNEFNGLADPTPGLPLDPTSRVALDPPPVEKFNKFNEPPPPPAGVAWKSSTPPVEKFSAALALCPHDCATFSI
jgi:hypothetical protein